MRQLAVALGIAWLLGQGPFVDAAEKAPPKDVTPAQMADKFLDAAASGKIDAAFDGLLEASPLLQQGSTIDMLKAQAKAQLPLFGEELRREQVDRRELGTSVVILRYIVAQEKEPMTWAFVFYKPHERWIVTALRWMPSLDYVK
jgi:hypothetical protein